MILRSLSRVIVLLLVLCAGRGLMMAQFDQGAVLGTIKDVKGGAVNNATVTLTNVDTGVAQKATSADSGDYLFPTVRIGNYKVEAEATGFSKSVVGNVNVTVTSRQRVDFTLQVGQVSETVNVTEAAPLLETDSSSKGQVIQQKQIVNLPILGRSYANLALLAPGVRQSQVGNQGDISFRREGSYNVNGLRSVFNNFLLDGIDNNFYGTTNQGFSNQSIQPAPDAVAEFRLSINAYSAEYGRTGGAVINVSSRSGTNSYHGTLWDFFQNTSLNANGFFRAFVTRPSDGSRVFFPKPQVNRNQFGAVFGGPIIKNRTFFFAEYEGSRWIQSPFGQATLPSLDARRGVTSSAVTIPYSYQDLNGRTIAAGTQIPAGGLVPLTKFASTVLNALPAPNVPGSPTLYIGSVRNQLFEDKGSIKIDHQLRDNLNLFARYAHRGQSIEQPGLVTGLAGGNAIGFLDIFNQQGIIGTTWSKSPTEVVEVRFAVTRLGADRRPASVGGPSLRELFGITGLPEGENVRGGITPQDISGFSRIGRQSTNPQAQFPDSYNLRVNLIKNLGRHNLKMGYEFLYLAIQVDDTNPLYGIDAYNGSVTGNALADFYIGARAGYQIATQIKAQVRQQAHWWYIQDDWKVNDKLTINAGLRYELTSPVYDANNRLSNFDPRTARLVQASGGSISDRGQRNLDKNNFAPRIGAAFQLNSKTVLRGGYGLGYNYWNRMASAELLSTNAPFVTRFSQTQSGALARTALCDGNNFANCFRRTQDGYPTNLPSNVILYIQKDSPWGYIQNWHFSIQRQITKDALVDVAYVGNRGNLLPLLADFNQARPITAAELAAGQTSTATLSARRPYQNFGNITAVLPLAFSNYNALQAKFEYRGRTLTFLNSFTYGKAIDNAGQVLETANQSAPASPQDVNNPNNDRGPSGFDQRFNNTASAVWDVPVGKGRQFARNLPTPLEFAIGGWQLTSTITLTSGQPLGISYGDTQFFLSDNQPSFLGGVSLRPNVVPGVPLKFPSNQQVFGGGVQYLNPAAVSIPTANAPFGNLGRNAVYGYPLYQTDLGVHKSVPIKPLGEQGRLEFRAEFFNLFNKTNFQAPTIDRRSGNYGRVTSTFDPRGIQLALKLFF